MNNIYISRGLIVLSLVLMSSSFAPDPLPKRFTPVGTWEYTVPGVQAVYEKGSMLVKKEEKDYKVTMILNEYSKAEAENVVYKKKTLSFSILLENEEILVQGTFDKDEFKGSISDSEGDFTLTAKRIN